jgi:molybdopterin molybdotransferase
MLDIADAQQLVLSQVRSLPVVECSLRDALLRTLASPVVCDLDDPPFEKALMDGYAVRSADVAQFPTRLRVVGQVAAGHLAEVGLGPGQAIQINTGAPLPPGADAVVRVEDTEVAADHVLIRAPAATGKFVVQRGTYARANKPVLPAGSMSSIAGPPPGAICSWRITTVPGPGGRVTV